jgi:uncharacterized protein YaiE (UPF0345 family)
VAWSTPRTWASGELVTAGNMNTYISDNLRETAAAKVAAAGDLTYGTAANTLTRLAIGSTNQLLQVVSGNPAWSNFPQGLQFQNSGDNGKKVQIGTSSSSTTFNTGTFCIQVGTSVTTTTFGTSPRFLTTGDAPSAVAIGVGVGSASTTGFTPWIATSTGGTLSYAFGWEGIG